MSGMGESDHTSDVVIVGSGAGGLTAGLVARSLGADALVLEKQETIGGNTALSGGTMWIPANPLMREEGIPDSLEEGLAYLEACVGDHGPATSRARKLAYLEEGLRLVEFLRGIGIPLIRVPEYADYYAELPGGNARGRALQVPMFDLDELGPFRDKVLNLAPFLAYVEEAPEMTLMARTRAGLTTTVRVAARTAWARARRTPMAANGAALVGRLLQAGLRSGLDVWTEASFEDFLVDGGRVVGVRARRRGREVTIVARRAVLVASGGFAHNLEMRQQHGRRPASVDWTLASPGETGEVVQATMRLGAATDMMDEGIWMPMALSPSGPLYIVYERGKPHSIMVDGEGRRYFDESSSYMTAGQIMYDQHAKASAIPSWLIMDARHRRRYPFGLEPPGRTPKEWIRSGFMKKADTLAELAGRCGIDARRLEETVRRFNRFAATGVDEDFHRGETIDSRHFGDPRVGPNPGLGSIEKAPFYAVAVYPGDLGTFGGILTDEHSRVLREDGSAIEGLYATGNATAPVMGRIYPCTGCSIASTAIFGSVAAKHALGQETTDVDASALAAVA